MCPLMFLFPCHPNPLSIGDVMMSLGSNGALLWDLEHHTLDPGEL